MTTTWFTSDLHLGHKTVAKIRGYDDTDIHEIEELILHYDGLVGPSQPNEQEDEMTSEVGPKYLEAQS